MSNRRWLVPFWTGVILTSGLIIAFLAPIWKSPYPTPPVPTPYAFVLGIVVTLIIGALFGAAAIYARRTLGPVQINPPRPELRQKAEDPTNEHRAQDRADYERELDAYTRVVDTQIALKSPITMLTSAIVLAVMLVFLTSLLIPGQDNLLVRISDGAYARGIITYLFAVGTIGVFLLLVFSVLTKKLDKDQYDGVKSILSLLLGIFGTIIGFYYGQASSDRRVDSLQIAALAVPDSVARGDTLSLSGVVTGGAPPYIVLVQDETGARALDVDVLGGFRGKTHVSPLLSSGMRALRVHVEVRDGSGGPPFHLERMVSIKPASTSQTVSAGRAPSKGSNAPVPPGN